MALWVTWSKNIPVLSCWHFLVCTLKAEVTQMLSLSIMLINVKDTVLHRMIYPAFRIMILECLFNRI